MPIEALLLLSSPIVLLVGLVYVAKTLSDNRTKREIAAAHVSEEVAHALVARNLRAEAASALKWGLVAVGVGLAFVLGQFLPARGYAPLTTGLTFIFGGAALILFYRIGPRDEEAPPRGPALVGGPRPGDAPDIALHRDAHGASL